jgi:AbrB family looped-hinge helix DNA binding protein
MEAVTVSVKYQVVIPEHVRNEEGIRPGDKLVVIVKHGILHLVPLRSIARTKGFLSGLEVDLGTIREHHDRA